MELFLIVSAAAYYSTSNRKPKKLQYIPFEKDDLPDTVVVDCAHPTSKQLTHHLKYKGQKQLMNLSLRGDSSSDAVLNAIVRRDPITRAMKFVSTNHFDIDSFISVWCLCNPEEAEIHEQILREVAKIGDFRELRLDHLWQHKALQLACWLNSEERRLFYRPFESAISVAKGEEEGIGKFEYFLPIFGEVINDTNRFSAQWVEEYDRVVKEYKIVSSSPMTKLPNLGLVTLRIPYPVHYYSLFSVTLGFDVVLTMYSDRRYEVECKYTSYVDIASRRCLPRVDMTPLAKYLNELEDQRKNSTKHIEVIKNTATYAWRCDRMTDSGPILRIELENIHLTKAERYGHPYERPIHPSLIAEEEMERIVTSFFTFAYSRESAKRQEFFEWNELHDFNAGIDWASWSSNLVF
jgi:hypothetical protein